MALFGIALGTLITLAALDAHVTPPDGGCFGAPGWFLWASGFLVPATVVAASAGAGIAGLRLRWSKLVCIAFAVSVAVGWFAVLLITMSAVEQSC